MEEERQQEEETKDLINRVKEESESIIEKILKEGIETENISFLSKIIDIHKDMSNEEYWKAKEESFMRYRGYDREEYGRGRSRDSRGRFRGDESYGRRGVKGTGRGRYRGHDMIDEMQDHYGNYSEAKEEYGNGNYGAKKDTMESLECMLESVVDFMEMLKKDASSQEEVEMIREYARQISEL